MLEIMESLRLEKTFKILNHNCQLNTMFSTKPCPQLPIHRIFEQFQEWRFHHFSGSRKMFCRITEEKMDWVLAARNQRQQPSAEKL